MAFDSHENEPNPTDDPLDDVLPQEDLAEHLTDEQIAAVNEVWDELERRAKSCQKSWGLGFPAVSMTILKPKFRKMAEALTKGE